MMMEGKKEGVKSGSGERPLAASRPIAAMTTTRAASMLHRLSTALIGVMLLKNANFYSQASTHLPQPVPLPGSGSRM